MPGAQRDFVIRLLEGAFFVPPPSRVCEECPGECIVGRGFGREPEREAECRESGPKPEPEAEAEAEPDPESDPEPDPESDPERETGLNSERDSNVLSAVPRFVLGLAEGGGSRVSGTNRMDPLLADFILGGTPR